ncbi:MAG: RNA polymerase sigma factor [Flavobacteriia bacterium]
MNAREYNIAVDTYADNIYRFALKHLKNEMSAKDIVQETFMKVWDKHEEVSNEKVKSYLFTTAYHAIIDWIKKEKRSADFDLADKHLAMPKGQEFDLPTILEWALNRLPEIQKTVVLLRDYEGYAYDEIAEITSLSESQVKVYIFRARQSLKTFLKQKELVA